MLFAVKKYASQKLSTMITQPMVINAADYECHRYTVGLIADDLETCNFIVFIRQKNKKKALIFKHLASNG